MWTKEAATRAIERFDEAIYSIRDAKFPGISDMAEECIALIAPGPFHGFDVTPKTNLFYCLTLTGFDLAPLGGYATPHYSPVVVVDIGRLIGSVDQAHIQGDLVRTIAIASQYAFNGYQRRLREVYGDALDIQTEWLKAKNTPPIPFDPRTQDRESLLIQLLGKAQYYTDLGFTDWQRGVDLYLDSNPDPAVRRELLQTRDNIAHFLTGRKHFHNVQYESAMEAGGEIYVKLNAEDRATYTALALAMITELGEKLI